MQAQARSSAHAMALPPLALSMSYWGPLAAAIVIGLAVKAGLALWAYRDATRRGDDGRLWAAAVFLFDVVALPVWFVVRRRHPTTTAPSASQPRTSNDQGINTRPATADAPPASGPPQTVRTRCPSCETQIVVDRTPGVPTPITCPSCGRQGRI